VSLFLTSAWVILLDQITKTIVTRQIAPWDNIECLGGLLQITNVHNPGAAFGILQNKQILSIVAAIVAAVLILLFYPRIPRHRRSMRFGMALALGGALGNLIDRVKYSRCSTPSGHITQQIQGNHAGSIIRSASAHRKS
jgi:signal peptidase II